VRQALRLLTCAGHPDLQALAEIARLPVRTLQRRLSESGLSFRSLVQESQLADALRLMQDPSLKLIDVAFELGFSDPAHFTRAFRRWTGVSPRAFRRLGSPARAENAPIFTGIRSAGAKGQEPIDRRQHPMRQAAP
jgi:AraC-like DNA-binding protein